jgi:carbon monoxide dehydrogenase subunit G
MEIRNDFGVSAGAAETYELLVDLERVARCIPGGEVGAPDDHGGHAAAITVKLGPMRLAYKGTVAIDERDESGRGAVLSARMRDARSQGTAKATMQMAVREAGSGAMVETATELQLTGRAAQMGSGMVDDVAARLVEDMAACIGETLGATDDAASGADPTNPPQAKPVQGIRLMLRVLLDRIKMSFKRKGGKSDA